MGSLDAQNKDIFGLVSSRASQDFCRGEQVIGKPYNPFATEATSQQQQQHHPARYNPLSQSLPSSDPPGSGAAAVNGYSNHDHSEFAKQNGSGTYACYKNNAGALATGQAHGDSAPEFLASNSYGCCYQNAAEVPRIHRYEDRSDFLPFPVAVNGYYQHPETLLVGNVHGDPDFAALNGYRSCNSCDLHGYTDAEFPGLHAYGNQEGACGYDRFERPEFRYSCNSYAEVPGSARGYNPFSQDYELSGTELSIPHEQAESSLIPYSYLPARACTPPSVRQYVHPPVYPVHPLQEELPEAARIPPKDAVVPFDSGNTGKSQRLLWLSEEEAEIIRLIRLSQMKENLRSSGFSLSDDQLSPVSSPNPVTDSGQTNGKAALSSPSNVSSMSVDDLPLPNSAEPVRTKAIVKKEVLIGKEIDKATKDDAASTDIQIDAAKIVDDDRQWIALQRKKIKDIQARKQQNAAVCIQRNWREYSKKIIKSRKSMNKNRVPIREKPKAKKKDKVHEPRRLSVQEAAKVIQRVWRASMKRRRTQKAKPKLPKTLKGLYECIKFRHSTNGLSPPSYVRFLKLLDRIHACTEGARVRKRLNTRRLQAIVKEIKEIRALLDDMSTDTGPTSAELLSQLSGQLQQKIVQLRTALQGPGDAARNLLRRGPATPLVIYGSRSKSPTSYLQKSGDQVQIRVIGNTQTENGVPSLRCSLFTVDKPTDDDRNDLRTIRSGLASSEGDVPSKPSYADMPVPVRRQDVSRKGVMSEIQKQAKTSEYFFIEKDIETQLQVPRSRNDNLVASKLSQYLVNGSSRSVKEPDDYGYESTRRTLESFTDDIEQQLDQDRPKRPFLRRKSIAMAPQKLDWSKVKPMVSSRLEPELKTKLYKSKVKEIARNACSRKTNYSNVKSRLFSYETQLSAELSTERSIEAEYEVASRQGYVEIHTQVDMSCKEDCWRPASVNSEATICQDEPVPNHRYAEDSGEQEFPPTTKLKAPSSRYGKVSDSYAESRCTPEGSALEEIDHNGELERKKQSHSLRAKESTPEASPSVKESVREITTKRDRNGEKKEADRVAGKRDDNDNSRSTKNEASPELEATFKHVMSIKDDCKMSVGHLFGVSSLAAKTVVPRLSPGASVFSSSFSEKRRLHELLIQEGRASKLQHDSLAFVSIRD